MALLIKGAMVAKRHKQFKGPVLLDVIFDYAANETRIEVCSIEGDPEQNWKSTRADLDNLVKQINEGLQDSGLLADDAQVAVLWARKVQ
jgi:Holliday junction resolvase RusA-like endonuclease